MKTPERKTMRSTFWAFMLIASMAVGLNAQDLDESFRNPPETAKPWTFWFWINGNMSREGITKDLEAMKQKGINGVLWMEVSGPQWAPQGQIEAGTKPWGDTMQWAIAEADRLGMAFDMTVDFGYGTGGPHIRPDNSMQKLVWSETNIKGGETIAVKLKKPVVDYRQELKKAWLRPGKEMNPVVTKALKDVDSYRDIAVFAVKSSGRNEKLIKDIVNRDGRGWKNRLPLLTGKTAPPAIPRDHIIDLTAQMKKDGKLEWSAPKGSWKVIRLGHASNFKMTRPSPHAAVGLECDRLNPRGIEAHFEHHLKPILEAAGGKAGKTLQYIHIDSWEANGQNWTAGFAEAFQKRRGYDIRPWLPVLTGRVVQSADATNRFLWDMRQTVSDMMLDHYIDRLRELIAPYGIKFSCESYGHFCVDNLTYGARSEFPIAEFWTERISGRGRKAATNAFDRVGGPAGISSYCYLTMKALASVANTYGQSRVGAEAFTGCRGWVDHPALIKSMGDEAFTRGINHYIYHLWAHQPYDNMVPGLTHRKWGQHINRYQTWWDFSKPYFDYVARCQFLLRQGRTGVDFACLYHEGAPVGIKENDVTFNCPPGYDYDLCSPEIIQRMAFKNGRIHLPTGVSYRYLVLPESGRLTLTTARKVEALHQAGASVYQQTRIVGTPGFKGYPEANRTVCDLAKKWPMLPKEGWRAILTADKQKPDFEGVGLRWIHRRCKDDDIYFVANGKDEPVKQSCTFRIDGKTPELWDPETGKVFALSDVQGANGRTSVDLQFGPSQSWFVVFRKEPTAGRLERNPFPSWKPVQAISGEWSLSFNPKWGTKKTLDIKTLRSWSEHPDPLVKYYSGTGTYRSGFDVPKARIPEDGTRLCLDLGKVAVVARVKLNDKDCGIAWKHPYRVDITGVLQEGSNELVVEVANTWVNRLIGDEQLPSDSKWKDWETLLEWPKWFTEGKKSPAGRYTFTSARHYNKKTPLHPAGLLGPVRILSDK